MTRKLKVGDHVIVPAAVRGIGEEMKAVVTDVEKGVMGSPNFITCLYVEPSTNSLGETMITCLESQLVPI
ncbi:MAG: hypothetical protein ACI4AK_01560 [Lepagella sp.]